MAILWQTKRNGVLYQVRTAGRSRRLYSDGVCHTQYHPQRVLTGSVWDLLLLPAFFKQDVNSIQNVLLLGLGGGALIHMLKHYFQPEKVTAIELDSTHIYIAKRFFQVGRRGVEIIEGDATRWLNQYHGPKFDLIIDDLFSHQGGIPRRAVDADEKWFRCLSSNLKHDGLSVMNFAERREFNLSAYMLNSDIAKEFSSVFQLSTKLLDNRIMCFSTQQLDRKQLKKNLSRYPEFSSKQAVQFNLRQIN